MAESVGPWTRPLTLEIVREQYRVAVAAVHSGTAELHRYNMLLAELARDLLVPPGHAIDVHGDGTVKPAAECKPYPDR